MALCCSLDCHRKSAIIVGDCKYCNQSFCLHHRLPETHQCPQLDKCKERHFNLNRDNLNNNKLK